MTLSGAVFHLGRDLLRSIYVQNLKSLYPPIMKIGNATQKVEIQVVRGSYGSLKIMETVPLNRAYTNFY